MLWEWGEIGWEKIKLGGLGNGRLDELVALGKEKRRQIQITFQR